MRYNRAVLTDVLVYHYRVAPGKGCGCGWGSSVQTLGLSWPEHIADVYEQRMRERAKTSDGTQEARVES